MDERWTKWTRDERKVDERWATGGRKVDERWMKGRRMLDETCTKGGQKVDEKWTKKVSGGKVNARWLLGLKVEWFMGITVTRMKGLKD